MCKMAKSQIICFVDDEPAIRETLENVLSDEGYPVMSCRDAEDFYAKLEKQTPALVLLDIWPVSYTHLTLPTRDLV